MTTDAETGKKSLTAVVVGLAIAIFAVLIINTIVGLIKTASDPSQQSETDELQSQP